MEMCERNLDIAVLTADENTTVLPHLDTIQLQFKMLMNPVMIG